ncbi:hypothetical protein AB3Z07_27005 (plasmid) [Metabacillus halosaccharovorans]|uniref:hypothetical protein n=1 Tax=Metabacillus halosaccharovorans TaxID=930124 RepID=UPI00203C0E00|nr:hypothetical protein [Metabacillus halosaccharovorans]MCM3444173.1 hypothetical protein [Metabacillus halosaccharovorans]
MKSLKCEFGFDSPFGREICESFVKLANEHSGQKLSHMRYEGVARQSQIYRKIIVDQIWNFLPSVKVGVWLIVPTLAASAMGTMSKLCIWID